jgi:hypothetical protein
MIEKKQFNNFKSPDLSKLQEVRIDIKTSIFIAIGADPDQARKNYFSRIEAKNKSLVVSRKPVAS